MKWCSPKCGGKFNFRKRYHNDKEFRKKAIEKSKRDNTCIYFMGKKSTIYTNGVTKEIKDSGFVEKEKDRILKDCIKNPAKYLKDDIND